MFKRGLVIAVAAILVSMMCILPIAADGVCILTPNAPVSVPNAKPTIDGKIDPGEGWSSAAKLDGNTGGHFWGQMQLTSSSDLYFAVSDDGLYFAVDHNEYHGAYTVRYYDNPDVDYYTREFIDPKSGEYNEENWPKTNPDGSVVEGHLVNGYKEIDPKGAKNAFWYGNAGNTTVYSTGADMMDSDYGFDGDVFALSIDPLGLINAEQYFSNQDKSLQFNVGIFKGDVVKVKTSILSDVDYSDKCKGAGKLTDDKITLEVFIPKDVVLTEVNNALTHFEIGKTLTWEEFCASGAVNRAEVLFMDRFMDPDAGVVDTWGRFITVTDVCDDGIPGWTISGQDVKGYGLKLTMPGVGGGDAPATQAADTTANNNSGNGQSTTAAGNNSASTTAAAASTTKTASTGASSNTAGSGQASQTFDAGIAVALGALACSGIGFVYTKKRKH